MGNFIDYPTPVKGESVYSWLVRAHLYSGYPSFRSNSLKPIIQHDELVCTEFPSFIPRISLDSGVDANWIAHYMTGLDYYRPFLSIELYQKLEASLLQGKTSYIHSKFGMIANRLLNDTELKSCPLCIDYDQQEHGFPYWHITHQLAGVTCCPFHLVQLNNEKRIRSLASYPTQKILTPASESEVLLSTNIITAFISEAAHFPKANINSALKNRLLELGMLTKCGSVRYKMLNPMLLEHLNMLPKNNHFLILREHVAHGSFPSNIFYHQGALHHPLKYYFLIHSLFGSWERFCNAIKQQPIEIKEASIKTRMTTNINDKAIVRLLKQGLSMRNIREQLGNSIAYIKKVAANNNISVDKRPSKIFSSDERAIWRKLFVGEPTSVIAKEFRVSIGAIEQVLAKHSYLVGVRKLVRFYNKRCESRQSVEDFISNNPYCTQKLIRLHCYAAYMWLYKHDREWFDKNMPSAMDYRLRHKGHSNDQ